MYNVCFFLQDHLTYRIFSVEYANLAIIDLAKAATIEGRGELVLQVKKALANHGFFYAINHGYTQAQVLIFILCCVLISQSYIA